MDAFALPPRPSIDWYRKRAKQLLRDARLGDPDATRRIGQCPRLASGTSEGDATPVLADAQYVVAREHGFGSWRAFAAHVEALGVQDAPVARFEAAADAIVAGDKQALERLLTDDPALVHARSTRAHRATLLHYVAANGVEDHRQKTPSNAVAIAHALLAAGAAPDAIAETYGGGPWQTPLTLLVSSVHPARAGLQEALVDALVDGGAAVEGVPDDGSPLLTALAFHHAAAAHALVRRGARIDTLAAAAGLGDEARVRAFLAAGTDGESRAPSRSMPYWLRLQRTPHAHRARALSWAAAFGHRGVVELLLDAGVPLDAADAEGMTALHWAAWMGHAGVVDALLARGAPLEAVNRYGGTPLGATVWSAVHAGREVDRLPVIERLLAAGARVDTVEYPSGDARIDAMIARWGA